MGMVVMSKRELNRLNVLARLDSELSASASSNLGIAASILVSWSRSTAQSIAGSRIEQLPARYWCSSTMRQAYRTSLALAEWLCGTADRIDPV